MFSRSFKGEKTMIDLNLQHKAQLMKTGFCVFLLAALSMIAAAQDTTTGTIQGIISDEQGAVVAGATVEARNVETNFSKSFTTESDGRFTLLSMPPGRYVVSVTKQGFAKLNQENIELTVGRLVSLNFALKVSGVSGEVTITTTPTIDTVKTESSTHAQYQIDRKHSHSRQKIRGPVDPDPGR